jgi:nucleoid-associated protein YgaU
MSARLRVLCELKVNEMFTAMINRTYLAVTLMGLALALGVGWWAYELHRERTADAPVSVTGPRAPQPAEATAVHEAPAAQTSADETAPPTEVAEPAEQAPLDGGSADEATARTRPSPAGPLDKPTDLAARSTAPAPPLAPEGAAPAAGPGAAVGQAPAATASIPKDEPVAETEQQVEARSSATQTEAPAPERAPSRSVEPQSPATANAGAAAPAAEGGSAPRVDADAHATAPAGPAPAEEGGGPPPSDAMAGPALGKGSPDESRAASSGASATIKRALSALFGGAADAPASEKSDQEPGATALGTPSNAGAADQARAADQGDLVGTEPGAGPTFDIVRIAPGGQAVIAGRAPPDAEVEIKSGDRVIDRVRADRRGEWVAVPLGPLPPGDQELSLVARAEELAAESDEVLVVAVPEPPPPQPAPRASGEPPPPQPPEVAAGQSPGAALAMALPRDGRGQGRILQAPGRLSSDGTLALMVLDYDETGRIRLRGEAPPGAPLKIYVDNAPVGAAVVEPSGQWSTVLEPSLAPGDYTLRLDQLDPAGKPTARLETPFTRASQPPVDGDVEVDFVIVQPGNSLWRIARRLLGQGVHYVHIYGANQGQIRDPDLIYPGQVFEIPSAIGSAG